MPVGRLDADTTGALLLTNDGELAHRLAHPRYGVEKTYVADVEGTPSRRSAARAREGVELEDGPTAPARARLLGPSRVELTIHEGRNRQVKRMLEAVGHPVRRLHRSAYAGLSADDLEPGAWRELSGDEVARTPLGTWSLRDQVPRHAVPLRRYFALCFLSACASCRPCCFSLLLFLSYGLLKFPLSREIAMMWLRRGGSA